MKEEFNRRKQRLGLIYGFFGGLAFSFAAWGYDAIILATSHHTNAFIKFFPGLLLSLAAGCLVGWMTIRLHNHLAAVGLWFLFALLLNWMVIRLTFSTTPLLIKQFQPYLVEWMNYPHINQLQQYRIIGMVLVTVPCVICGLLEINIIEQILLSPHNGSIINIILVCSLLLGAAGLGADYLINVHFRKPVQELDSLFTFAQENQGKEVNKEVAKRRHLSTVAGISDLLKEPRKLTLIAFDETLAQVNIMVNFNGTWVKCTTIYNQPIFCEVIQSLPKINY
jgi:hypothetical protein